MTTVIVRDTRRRRTRHDPRAGVQRFDGRQPPTFGARNVGEDRGVSVETEQHVARHLSEHDGVARRHATPPTRASEDQCAEFGIRRRTRPRAPRRDVRCSFVAHGCPRTA